MAGQLEKYVIGIVIFTLFIVGGVSWLSMTNNQNEQLDDYNNTFNKLIDINNQTTAMRDSIQDAETDFGAFGVLNSLISTSWQTLRLLFTSLDFMSEAYGGLSSFFGIPAWIPLLISSIVVIIIVFAIWGAVFQKEL